MTSNRERTLTRIGQNYSPLVLAEVEKAWLAALWDGEGTFSIGHRKNGRDDFALCIQVANTSFPLISRVVELLGPAAGQVTARKLRHSGKTIFAVQVRRLWQTEFLRAISPYIVAKTRQVEIAIACSSAFESAEFTNFPREIFERSYQEMHMLNNRRGRWSE